MGFVLARASGAGLQHHILDQGSHSGKISKADVSLTTKEPLCVTKHKKKKEGNKKKKKINGKNSLSVYLASSCFTDSLNSLIYRSDLHVNSHNFSLLFSKQVIKIDKYKGRRCYLDGTDNSRN